MFLITNKNNMKKKERNSEVFINILIIGFYNSKSLRVNFLKAVLPEINERGSFKACIGNLEDFYQLSSNMENTERFRSKHFKEVRHIEK